MSLKKPTPPKSTRAQKVGWLLANKKLWSKRPYDREAIAKRMRDDGLYSTATNLLDIKIDKLISEAVKIQEAIRD